MKNKRLIIIMFVSLIILLIPLVIMQFGGGLKWELFDFAIAGALLFGTGLICELVMRKVSVIKYRIAICVAFLLILILIFIEIAVGIVGSPISGS